MLVFNLKKALILFSLLVLFCIFGKVYCQIQNTYNMSISLDSKELNKNDKDLTIKIIPVRNDYVEIKGKYYNIRFYSKVSSSMFEELDSLKIFLNSKVRNKNRVSIEDSIFVNYSISWKWMASWIKYYEYPSHIITFYYPRNGRRDKDLNNPNNYVYWHNITDEKQDSIFQSERMYPDVFKMENRTFSLCNNEKKKLLLDTLSHLSDDENLKAFYFNIFHSVIQSAFYKSDNEMKEILIKPCMNILLSNSEYVLNYLYCFDDMKYLKQYAQILGNGFYLKKKGLLNLEYNFVAFKREMKKNKSKWMEKLLATLFSEIEEVMKSMDNK